MKKTVLLTLVTVLTAFYSLSGQDRITGLPYATRSEVIAKHGMAATSQPLATQVALDILKTGGNAIDAAIAANAMLGLVEPTGCGIGGDLFAIVWHAKTGRLYGLNASGRSPESLTASYFKENGSFLIQRQNCSHFLPASFRFFTTSASFVMRQLRRS